MIRKFLIGLPLILVPVVGDGRAASEPRPADRLLRLVPADAAGVLILEDLRTRLREARATNLAEALGRLHAFQAWRDSESGQKFSQAIEDIEGALGVGFAAVRDEILGDAAVLAIRPGPPGQADQARGLILVRPRDRALLDRLVAAINRADQDGGTLLELADRRRGAVTYHVRRFRPGSKPDEAFASFDDGVFAWTNSEDLLRDVIDRHGGGPAGLGDDPDVRSVRDALPARALASLILNPRAFNIPSLQAEPPKDPVDGLLRRLVTAVRVAGVALEWQGDGLFLHAHERLDPERLDEPLRRLLTSARGDAPPLGPVPGDALAVASFRIDLGALADELSSFIPEADRAKFENMKVALGGIFLGRDLRKEVLPRVGPGFLGVLGALDGPDLALRAAVDPQSGVSAALDNGLRTLLALTATDAQRTREGRRIESRTVDGVRVTGLSGPDWPFHYAVEPDRLVIGSNPSAVARLTRAAPTAGRFEEARARYFPGPANVLFVDVEALQAQARAHRDAIARKLAGGRGAEPGDAGGDLDRVLDLADPFRAAFATFEVRDGSTDLHQRFGLIARPPAGR